MKRMFFLMTIISSILASSLTFADFKLHHKKMANEFNDGTERIHISVEEITRNPYSSDEIYSSEGFSVVKKYDDESKQSYFYLSNGDEKVLFAKSTESQGIIGNKAKMVEAIMHLLNPGEDYVYSAIHKYYQSLDQKEWVKLYSNNDRTKVYLKDLSWNLFDSNQQLIKKYSITFSNF